jgi:hypothetical protein
MAINGTMQTACPSSVFVSSHAEDERLVESTLVRQQPPDLDKAGIFENPSQLVDGLPTFVEMLAISQGSAFELHSALPRFAGGYSSIEGNRRRVERY